jgi:SAM-dependent methyltransferase
MTALARTKEEIAVGGDELDWLMESVRTNRFLPEPEPQDVFVGDGDFRAIGAEYLGHLVRIGGLEPGDRVVDIGSGLGRLAVPLTQYLEPSATYVGVDPVRDGVAWCQKAITPVYPNFRFRHLDIAHPIYNPDGLLRGDSLVLPIGNASADFAFMVSVVTHLPPAEVEVYAREIARVLAPGGRCFVTSFIMDDAAKTATARDPRRAFVRTPNGPDWYTDSTGGLGAVAFDDGWLDGVLVHAGLVPIWRGIGHWRGTPSSHYQDIIVAKKPGSPT